MRYFNKGNNFKKKLIIVDTFKNEWILPGDSVQSLDLLILVLVDQRLFFWLQTARLQHSPVFSVLKASQNALRFKLTSGQILSIGTKILYELCSLNEIKSLDSLRLCSIFCWFFYTNLFLNIRFFIISNRERKIKSQTYDKKLRSSHNIGGTPPSIIPVHCTNARLIFAYQPLLFYLQPVFYKVWSLYQDDWYRKVSLLSMPPVRQGHKQGKNIFPVSAALSRITLIMAAIIVFTLPYFFSLDELLLSFMLLQT